KITLATNPSISNNHNPNQVNAGVRINIKNKPSSKGEKYSRFNDNCHCKPTATITTGTSVDDIRPSAASSHAGYTQNTPTRNARIKAINGGKASILRTISRAELCLDE